MFLLGVIVVSLVFMSSLFMSSDDPDSPDDLVIDNGSTMTNTSSSGDDIKQLNVAVSMTDSEFKVLEELGRSFMSSHSVLVHLHNLPKDEVYEQYKSTSQLGEAYDVMLLDNVWVNEFAALGYLEPLEESLMLALEANQIDPMLSQVRWNGFLWAVPKEIDPYILAWNKKKYMDFDIEVALGSYEELIAANHLFTNLEEQEHGVYFDFHDPYAFISLLWTLGGEWIDPVEHKPTMLRQEIIERLNTFFYAEREEEEENILSPPLHELYPIQNEHWNPWEAMNNDQMAIMITSLSDYMRNAGETIGMSALPAYYDEINNITYGGWMNGRSFAISSKSEVTEEAFLWTEYMTTPEIQLRFMNSGGALPVFHTAYESSYIQDKPYFDQIVDSIEEGSIFPIQPEMSEKILVLQEALIRLRLNELSIPDFLEDLEWQWQELSNY